MADIPKGNSKEDIKKREKIIKNFYAEWISKHPDKKIWNNSLRDYINVRFISINETASKASLKYESTRLIFSLSNILRFAVKVSERPPKNNKNQKGFVKIIILQHTTKDDLTAKLTVGVQRTGNKIQYCITEIKKD